VRILEWLLKGEANINFKQQFPPATSTQKSQKPALDTPKIHRHFPNNSTMKKSFQIKEKRISLKLKNVFQLYIKNIKKKFFHNISQQGRNIRN
jgi:hypothetical protein